MAVKFRAHDTFFIRKGWLNKGMKHVDHKPNVFVDRTENPMDVLGIGANMVKALRYWLQAVGVTEEPPSGTRTQSFTEFGQLVFDNDKFIEEIGTLYLLHYKMVSNEEFATAWYIFFNEFNMTEITKEDFVIAVNSYLSKIGEAVASRSIEDDFTCIINTYLPRFKSNPNKVSPENNIDCPFGELGLIDFMNKNKKVYRKSIPSVNSFDPWVILAVIFDRANGNIEVPLNDLLTTPSNIGKVFNLDAISMLDILHRVEKTGVVKIIRTAGLDIIQINKQMSFEQCVKKYYQSIQK
ncbi:DUF4007 family protein [Robinsoniella peoriensis]|uniref:DUF4007 family protein n=1 Tax=Robinsoniella peoriensis TaxID=180332 RepID=UPI000ABCBDCC|nr:DUF4007 family protein [Robinsoniella peoriensis]